MSNPGPAISNSTHPSNLNSQQALRVLAVLKGVSVAALGDTPLPVINSALYLPTTIVIANANNNGATQSVASVALGIYTAPSGASGSGTAVLTTAALTGQTTPSYVTVSSSTDTATALSAQTLYINQTTAVATATVDVYVYGYDLSPGYY
jgi:hypothetical protein